MSLCVIYLWLCSNHLVAQWIKTQFQCGLDWSIAIFCNRNRQKLWKFQLLLHKFSLILKLLDFTVGYIYTLTLLVQYCRALMGIMMDSSCKILYYLGKPCTIVFSSFSFLMHQFFSSFIWNSPVKFLNKFTGFHTQRLKYSSWYLPGSNS